jgi:two-component system, cell cycle sensor histidine kinase and response regulator CckA
LLAFSRKQPLRLALVDLNHTVNEMTRMLARILGEDIRMELKLSTRPALIRADESMIEQVLLNFAVNARDAMPKGGNLIIETEVRDITAALVPPHPKARSGRFVSLTVSDSGCGIAPDILPRIFEPFFTTKDVGKGTGLGLATVYGIVEQHEGWISVYSEVDRGTTFRIFLPSQSANTLPPVAAAVTSTAPMALTNHVILLVEDEASVRSLVRRVLSRHGYNVLEAATGHDAIQTWQQHRKKIDLVLTDLVMPDGMGGQELARQLRQEVPDLPIIFTSGYSATIAGKDFPFMEGVNFLAKPYDHDKLLKIIRTALEARRT